MKAIIKFKKSGDEKIYNEEIDCEIIDGKIELPFNNKNNYDIELLELTLKQNGKTILFS